jgi:hypothetical protein
LWPAIRRLQPFRYLHSCSGCFRLEHFAGWDSHPLESAAFARRTPESDIDALLDRYLSCKQVLRRRASHLWVLTPDNMRDLLELARGSAKH